MNTTSSKVVTSVQRRRRYTPNEKMRMIEETYKPGESVSSVAFSSIENLKNRRSLIVGIL